MKTYACFFKFKIWVSKGAFRKCLWRIAQKELYAVSFGKWIF